MIDATQYGAILTRHVFVKILLLSFLVSDSSLVSNSGIDRSFHVGTYPLRYLPPLPEIDNEPTHSVYVPTLTESTQSKTTLPSETVAPTSVPIKTWTSAVISTVSGSSTSLPPKTSSIKPPVLYVPEEVIVSISTQTNIIFTGIYSSSTFASSLVPTCTVATVYRSSTYYSTITSTSTITTTTTQLKTKAPETITITKSNFVSCSTPPLKTTYVTQHTFVTMLKYSTATVTETPSTQTEYRTVTSTRTIIRSVNHRPTIHKCTRDTKTLFVTPTPSSVHHTLIATKTIDYPNQYSVVLEIDVDPDVCYIRGINYTFASSFISVHDISSSTLNHEHNERHYAGIKEDESFVHYTDEYHYTEHKDYGGDNNMKMGGGYGGVGDNNGDEEQRQGYGSNFKMQLNGGYGGVPGGM